MEFRYGLGTAQRSSDQAMTWTAIVLKGRYMTVSRKLVITVIRPLLLSAC